MTLTDLKNLRVMVVGLGLTGQSCVRFLMAQGASVSAMDSREDMFCELDIPVHLGVFDSQLLCSVQLIVVSPGVDPSNVAICEARNAGVEVIGDVELFARFNQIPVIAITGSNGKSTVTTLITEMINNSQYSALMGGNIGTPVLELLDTQVDYLVLELSSFQLETVESLRPQVAVVLNVSEDHLDRHLTLDNYAQTKRKIYRQAQYTIANRDDKQTWPEQFEPTTSFGLTPSSHGYSWDSENQTVTYQGKVLLEAKDCLLSGVHNMLNVQAALACIGCLNIDLAAVKPVLKSFGGLPHRFEVVSHYKQAVWINDSKATNIGATIAAIKSVDKGTGKLVLIAGGDGKNADFSELQPILLESVDLVITLGKDGSKIAALKPGSIEVHSLEEAVAFACEIVDCGDVVLLSPACASLDMFRNYQHRGEVFRMAIGRMAA